MQEFRHFDTGMVVRIQPPELLGLKNLVLSVKCFLTWACCHCDEALEIESVVKAGETTRSAVGVMRSK